VEADKNEVIQYIKTVESRLTTCVTDAGATVQDLVQQLPVKTGQQLLGVAGTITSAVKGSLSEDMGSLNARIHELCIAVEKGRGADAFEAAMATVRDGMESLKREAVTNHRSLVESMRTGVLEPLNGKLDATAASVVGMIERTLKSDVVAPLTASSMRLHDNVKAMPHEVVSLLSQKSDGEDIESRERVFDRLDNLKTLVLQHAGDLKSAQHQLSGLAAGEAARSNQMGQIPTVVRDYIKGSVNLLETQSADSAKSLATLTGCMNAVQGALATMTAAADAAKLRVSSSVGKGQAGEQRLLLDLSDRLKQRDGFEVVVVSGQAHQCDLAVQKLGRPEIRIESKAYGEHNGAKVGMKDVVKFQNDLLGLDMHGIMVSLHGGIVGRCGVEVEQLRNGRFAVYLSNNNYDVDQIADMVQLLYTLDTHTRKGEDMADTVNLTPETLHRVRDVLASFVEKIRMSKNHLKETQNLLNDMSIMALEQLLVPHSIVEEPPVPVPAEAVTWPCDLCSFVGKTERGCKAHKKKMHAA
jgi:hypothetical protein